jgi:hypothetical protein
VSKPGNKESNTVNYDTLKSKGLSDFAKSFAADDEKYVHMDIYDSYANKQNITQSSVEEKGQRLKFASDGTEKGRTEYPIKVGAVEKLGVHGKESHQVKIETASAQYEANNNNTIKVNNTTAVPTQTVVVHKKGFMEVMASILNNQLYNIWDFAKWILGMVIITYFGTLVLNDFDFGKTNEIFLNLTDTVYKATVNLYHKIIT